LCTVFGCFLELPLHPGGDRGFASPRVPAVLLVFPGFFLFDPATPLFVFPFLGCFPSDTVQPLFWFARTWFALGAFLLILPLGVRRQQPASFFGYGMSLFCSSGSPKLALRLLGFLAVVPQRFLPSVSFCAFSLYEGVNPLFSRFPCGHVHPLSVAPMGAPPPIFFSHPLAFFPIFPVPVLVYLKIPSKLVCASPYAFFSVCTLLAPALSPSLFFLGLVKPSTFFVKNSYPLSPSTLFSRPLFWASFPPGNSPLCQVFFYPWGVMLAPPFPPSMECIGASCSGVFFFFLGVLVHCTSPSLSFGNSTPPWIYAPYHRFWGLVPNSSAA